MEDAAADPRRPEGGAGEAGKDGGRAAEKPAAGVIFGQECAQVGRMATLVTVLLYKPE